MGGGQRSGPGRHNGPATTARGDCVEEERCEQRQRDAPHFDNGGVREHEAIRRLQIAVDDGRVGRVQKRKALANRHRHAQKQRPPEGHAALHLACAVENRVESTAVSYTHLTLPTTPYV